MSIRRLHYQIDYVHVLAFKEHYKEAVAPYFVFENVEYGIDDDGTINEGIRLIFKNEHMAIFFKKDNITLLYEGDVEALQNQNGPMKFFWDLFEKVKSFKTFNKPTRHLIIAFSVEIKDTDYIKDQLSNTPYFSKNPFGALDEFACVYEFRKEENTHKVNFGNFTKNDIKKYDLMPFGTEYNKDLLENVGMLSKVEIYALDRNPSFGKFKSLLSKVEDIFKKLDL